MCCVAASLKAEVRYATTSVTDIPFDMPRVALPDIPANTVCITDFGAVGDGGSLCTEAFAKAMQALAAKGGGRLVVPAGIWLTGPIQSFTWSAERCCSLPQTLTLILTSAQCMRATPPIRRWRRCGHTASMT